MARTIPGLQVVTGAFGYTGKYITRLLLAKGERVITLTGHPNRLNPFGNQVRAMPFSFNNPSALMESLRGATTLYNTYWVRFARGPVTFEQAIEHTRMLIKAAEAADIRRIVHVSITNASEVSPLPYFRGKGLVEQAVIHSSLSYAIIRPTVIFGVEDILINNIAWLLRRFPLFAIPGRGEYRLQPVFVEDVAEVAVNAAQRDENMIVDAVGSEVYTFKDLVRLIADTVRSRARIIHVKPALALFLSRLVSHIVQDVVLTREEVEGLMANLLVSGGTPTGETRLSEWLNHNANIVGTRYASELSRHYRGKKV